MSAAWEDINTNSSYTQAGRTGEVLVQRNYTGCKHLQPMGTPCFNSRRLGLCTGQIHLEKQPSFSMKSGLEMCATNLIKKNVTRRAGTTKKAFAVSAELKAHTIVHHIQSLKVFISKNGGPHCIPATAQWGKGRLLWMCVHTVHPQGHGTEFVCRYRLFSSVNMPHSWLNGNNTHYRPQTKPHRTSHPSRKTAELRQQPGNWDALSLP